MTLVFNVGRIVAYSARAYFSLAMASARIVPWVLAGMSLPLISRIFALSVRKIASVAQLAIIQPHAFCAQPLSSHSKAAAKKEPTSAKQHRGKIYQLQPTRPALSTYLIPIPKPFLLLSPSSKDVIATTVIIGERHYKKIVEFQLMRVGLWSP